MGLKPATLAVSVTLLLLLIGCAFLLAVAAHATTHSWRSSTSSMRPFLADTDHDGNVFTHKRALLTTRNAPIGFPPPPAMTSPSPPPY